MRPNEMYDLVGFSVGPLMTALLAQKPLTELKSTMVKFSGATIVICPEPVMVLAVGTVPVCGDA